MSELYYCQMTQNRLHETKECINVMTGHVDHLVIVDGGSLDESIIYLRNAEKHNPKLQFHLHPWEDNFPKQRNRYLSYVPSENWVVVSDPDEVFSSEACAQFRVLAAEAERDGLAKFDGVAFRANDITLQGDKVSNDSASTFHKPLMFYRYSDTQYDEKQKPHEELIRTSGAKYRWREVPYTYKHIKQDMAIWPRGARNFFVGGGGPNLGAKNPTWMPFRQLVFLKTRIQSWTAFHQYMIRGNIDQAIKLWMVDHRHESGYDGASEVREVYKTYFRLYHPEEEPQGLLGETIE